MDPMSGCHTTVTSVSCLHYRLGTVHCSTKDAYNSEITFLALLPWAWLGSQASRAQFQDITKPRKLISIFDIKGFHFEVTWTQGLESFENENVVCLGTHVNMKDI